MCGQVQVVIGGQSKQISDGESHKLVGQLFLTCACNAELHRRDQNLNVAAQARDLCQGDNLLLKHWSTCYQWKM